MLYDYACTVSYGPTALFIKGTIFSQNKTELISDFDIYRSILEKAHAGLYKYHSKNQIDSAFAVLAYIGSLHDEISLPEAEKRKPAIDAAFFPCPVKLVDGKLLINANEGGIPAGAEVLSINGEKMTHI